MKILYTNKGLMTESEYKDVSRFDKSITSYGEATNVSSPIVDFSKYVIKEARDQRCIDTTAPVVSEKGCIDEIDLSDLLDTQMDDMKLSKKDYGRSEKGCAACGCELDPGGYCMSGCDDEDGKATLYAEDAELDDAIFGKKAYKQKKNPDDLDLWEEEDLTPFLEPWRLMHKSLLASSRKLSNDWPDIYKDMTAKGVDGPKAMKFIRSFEATIDNMTQMLQLTKDTSRARANAANAIKRNPSIAKYIPKELGGAFEETDTSAMKESAPPGMEKDMNENSKKNSKGFRVSIAELRNIVAKVVKEEYNREEDGYLASLTWGQFPSREIMDRALEKGFKMTLKGMDKIVFEEAVEHAGINRLEAPYMVNEPEGFKTIVQALVDYSDEGGDEEDQLVRDTAMSLASSMMEVIGIEWI
jgi:hypothetical protein